MTKAMPRNPPKGIFSKAVAAWVRQKNRELMAANQHKRKSHDA